MSILSKVLSKIHKNDFKKSYAQSGEDIITSIILKDIKNGFYVDVGANNPVIQSNTNFFYRKGWSGINIDAKPGSMKVFFKKRKRDINLEIPVSDVHESVKFFMFNPSFYDTFSEEIANHHKDKLVGTKMLNTKKLSDVFDEVNISEIDFLSVDVEGYDLKVLKSNDWSKYRPKVIIIEDFDIHKKREDSTIYKFLSKKGYIFFCNTPTNSFYLEAKFLESRFSY